MAKKKGGKSKSSATKTVPQSAKSDSITDSINTEVIAEALSTANQPVLLKLCRLCEAKDGPFLNIFDADKVIAKKIDDLMPFGIEENDDLPHKICFRCSAKVEELYEFVQKCIKTQDSLRRAVGKMGALSAKTKTRTLWEEKLNQSNMSNDDICNALIKKAMEGIKDIPISPLPSEKDNEQPILRKAVKADLSMPDNEIESKKKADSKKKDQELTPIAKEVDEKNDQKVLITRASRHSNSEPLLEGLRTTYKKAKQVTTENNENNTSRVEKYERGMKRKAATKLEESFVNLEAPKKEQKPVETKLEKKPFDIMDHISMIKVNGVGVLFQCKLCNRNFLKKEVVMSHACAKNGGPKQDVIPEYLPPNPPKMPVVKYINTKTEGLHFKPAVVNDKPIVLDDDLPQPPPQPAPVKPKPKIGPASKIKRNDTESTESPSFDNQVTPNTVQLNAPTVQFPGLPSLNSRYKLVSGPNNTFTLVEEKVAVNTEYVSSDESNSVKPKSDKDKKKNKSKVRTESATISKKSTSTSSINTNNKDNKSNGNSLKDESKDVTEQPTPADEPYPVGLIKRPVEHTNDYDQPISDSIAFATPAMKKQSYTIVQTGNPSKLLISTKPKPKKEEVPKKKTRKQRHDNQREENSEQPFSVTLEDTTHPKDPGFFTFINVDPLLQPSYVLPTDNIIQESQISTSTPVSNSQTTTSKAKDKEKDKYTCNMCSEQFSREKKLLAHIHSHYNKMDEEDQLREKAQKKRGRKS